MNGRISRSENITIRIFLVFQLFLFCECALQRNIIVLGFCFVPFANRLINFQITYTQTPWYATHNRTHMQSDSSHRPGIMYQFQDHTTMDASQSQKNIMKFTWTVLGLFYSVGLGFGGLIIVTSHDETLQYLFLGELKISNIVLMKSIRATEVLRFSFFFFFFEIRKSSFGAETQRGWKRPSWLWSMTQATWCVMMD